MNVTRLMGVECQQCDSELNTGSNREPMKTGQHRCDVIAFLVIMTERARAFCTRCSLLRLDEEVPYSIELQ